MNLPRHIEVLADQMDRHESRLVLIEQLETYAERDLGRLIEMGEEDRVQRIIGRLCEKLRRDAA